jgi:hypothetical protein
MIHKDKASLIYEAGERREDTLENATHKNGGKRPRGRHRTRWKD